MSEYSDGTAFTKSLTGDVTIKPATGLDDPRASDSGRDLMQFFHGKTGGKRLLRRSDFSPMELKRKLVNTVILDVVYDEYGNPTDGIIRVMGSVLTAFYGEYTGKNIMSHPSDSGPRFMTAAKLINEMRCPVIGRSEQGLPDRPTVNVTTLFVPISDDGERVNQIFGMIELQTGEVGSRSWAKISSRPKLA